MKSKSPKSPEWQYAPYRATLLRNGKRFAIVTPDGRKALNYDQTETLMAALNRPAPKISKAEIERVAKELFQASFRAYKKAGGDVSTVLPYENSSGALKKAWQGAARWHLKQISK